MALRIENPITARSFTNVAAWPCSFNCLDAAPLFRFRLVGIERQRDTVGPYLKAWQPGIMAAAQLHMHRYCAIWSLTLASCNSQMQGARRHEFMLPGARGVQGFYLLATCQCCFLLPTVFAAAKRKLVAAWKGNLYCFPT